MLFDRDATVLLNKSHVDMLESHDKVNFERYLFILKVVEYFSKSYKFFVQM